MNTAYEEKNVRGQIEACKEYLKEAFYYEKNLYLINLAEQNLKRQLPESETVSHIEKPDRRLPDYKMHLIDVIAAIIAGVFYGGIIGLVISYVVFMLIESIQFMHSVYLFVGIVLLSCVLCLFVIADDKKNKDQAAREQLRQKQREYEQNLQRQKKQKAIEEIKRNIILRDIGNLEKEREKCSDTLKAIYACGIIHPKYQNFVAVASIYEYFDTGRCSSLEGRDGAYNIYEWESRTDKIVAKLDQVLEKLDQIQNAQFTLYSAIMESQEQSNALIFETMKGIQSFSEKTDLKLSKIVENGKLLSYNAQIAVKSAETLKHVVLYKERIGGPLPVSYPKFDR